MSRRQTLGVLTPLLGGSYFGRIIAGIHAVAQQRGVLTLVIPTGFEQVEHAQPQLNYPLAWQQVDGWIVVLNAVDGPFLTKLAATGKPIVTISQVYPALQAHAILPDNYGGTTQAVNHLISHGHRQIAFIGFLEQTDISERLAGYRAALAAADLPADEQLVARASDHMQAAGAAAVNQLLAAEVAFSAVVAATDTNAMGIIAALQAAGRRVPEDVAVTGFDDVTGAQYWNPPLTSIRQQFDGLGAAAAETMLALLADQPVANPVYVANQLIVRQSCGCPALPEAPDAATAPLSYELRRSLELALEHNTRISLSLLRDILDPADQLRWLQWTSARWGCLGLWDRKVGSTNHLLITSIYHNDQRPLPLIGTSYPPSAFPPAEMLPDSPAGGSDVITLYPIRTTGDDWGVLVLVGALEQTLFGSDSGVETTGQWAALLGAALERQALHGAIRQRAEELEASQAQLRNTNATLIESEGRYREVFEQTQSALAETEVLYQIARSLIGSESLSDVLQAVVDGAVNALSADQVALITLDLEARKVTQFVKGGPGSGQLRDAAFAELWDGLTGWVLRNLKPALSSKGVPDPRESAANQQQRTSSNNGSILVVPLRYRKKILGTMTAINGHDERDFTQRDTFLMIAISNQAAMAIENARLFEAAHRRAEEAETLQQAGAVVAATLRQDEAIERILEQLARVVPYDSASVQLLREGGVLEIVGGRGWETLALIVGIRFPIPGNNPNTLVIEGRKPHILDDVSATYDSFSKVGGAHIHSWMGVPLIVQDRVIGMLAIDKSAPSYFNRQHARLAAAFADQVAIAIENIRLYTAAQQELAERRRAEEQLLRHQEHLEEQVAARTAELQQLAEELSEKNRHLSHGLELAHDIQIGLLPSTVPWDARYLNVHACSIPAAEVGGDFYTFIPFREQYLGAVVIGDISGKGVAAALIMALVSSAIDTHVRGMSQPGELLNILNAQLTPRLKANRMNAALLVARINVQDRVMAVANGGMIAPLLLRRGQLIYIDSFGLPLGSMQDTQYGEVLVDLEPDDVIILISDGVVEAFHDASNEFFGFERLEAAVAKHPANMPLETLIDDLLAEVAAFIGPSEQHDDMTIVVIRPNLMP